MAETQIDSLVIEIGTKSNKAASDIDMVTAALTRLKGVGSFTKVVNNLTKLGNALDKISVSSAGIQTLNKISSAVSGLSSASKGNSISSVVNSLKKIPDVVSQLDDATINKFATAVNKISTAITPLTNKITALSAGFSRLPGRLSSCVTAANKYQRSMQSASAVSGGFFGKLKNFLGIGGLFSLTFATVGRKIGDSITEMNSYIENVNLFTVSMGKYADEAMDYAEKVQDAMGIDMSEFIRNQGIFMNMASGFGVAEDKAYKLSKGLTELAYDISSFYNVDVDTAFQRLQSGIAGEIEPVRRWGIALDQASMQEWMLKKGIDAKVNSLNQADKAMIRYNMMVEAMAGNGAIGDFARTLITPANAIRILQQQITQLSRAIGSLFIPILIKVIPYVQAFVKVLTSAIQTIASFFGFQMPQIDYSGMENLSAGASGASDSLDDAAKSAKKLKDYTMGFDELNIISPDTGSAGSNLSAGVSGLGLDPASVWDEGIMKSIDDQTKQLTDRMKVLLGIVLAIGAAFLIWKIGTGIASGLKAVMTILDAIRLCIKGYPGLAGMCVPAIGTITTALNGLATFFTTGIFKNGLGAVLMGEGAGTLATLSTVAGAIGLLGVGFYDVWKNSEPFRDGLKTIVDLLGELGKGAIKAVADLLGLDIEVPSLSALSKALSDATDGFLSLGDVAIAVGGIALFGPWGLAIEGVVLAIKGIGWLFEDVENEQGEMIPRWKSLWGDFKGWLSDTWDGIKTTVGGAWDNIKTTVGDGISSFVEKKKQEWEMFKQATGIVWDGIKTTIGGVWDSVKTTAQSALDSVKEKLSTWWGDVKSWFSQNVKPKFTKKYWLDLGTGIIDGFKDTFTNLKGLAAEQVNKLIDILNGLADFTIPGLEIGGKQLWKSKHITLFKIPKIQAFAKGGVIEDGLFTMNRGEIAGKFSNGKSVVANNQQIVKGITEGVIYGMQLSVGNYLKEVMPMVVSALTGIKDFVSRGTESIRKALTDERRELSSFIETKLSDFKSAITEKLSSIESALGSGFSGLESALSQISSSQQQVAELQQQASSLQQQLTEATSTKTVTTSKGIAVTVPSNASSTEIWNAKVVANAAAVGGQLYTGKDGKLHYTTKGVKKYATGGFLEDGLFTMNHGEIAGKFSNGKSVVANNQQIVDGIAQGVYQAMMQASRDEQDKPIQVTVVLDGKTVAKSVNKYNDGKGRSIMGNGLAYNY